MAEEFEEPVGPDGRLTQEALDIVNRHLREKFTQPCPSCGHRQFTIADRMYTAQAMTPGRDFDLLNSYPMVMVQCMNCGHAITYGARLVGLYKPIETGGKGE